MPQPCLLMECESSPREEEIPPLFWGLDPVFLAFAKLYIKDILEMKESQQVPGTYFYNGHPIRRVDIMGAVISVKERETFYSYGVDDATGVINCVCWKKLSNAESSSDPAILSTARELSMTSQQKIYHIIKEDCQKPNHMEKGCHLLHILNCVHLNLRWDLSKAVLQRVLELLEDQSDIVSTADHYYAAF